MIMANGKWIMDKLIMSKFNVKILSLVMNKVLVASREQLKCNFCTQWFTVDSDFARIQRYSLNCCLDCLQQFQNRIVHPETLEIYEVAFIKTGFTLKTERGKQLAS